MNEFPDKPDEEKRNYLINQEYLRMFAIYIIRTGKDEKKRTMFNLLSFFKKQYQLGTMFPIQGILSDVGLVAISDLIVSKPSRLTNEEYGIIKQHIEYGLYPFSTEDVESDLKNSMDSYQIDIIQNHHERMDGSGYPRGISGNDLSLSSKIIGLVDTISAIMSDRAYRQKRAHNLNEALDIVIQEQPNGFDNDLLQALYKTDNNINGIGSGLPGYMYL